jgi:hypothetical protein
MTRTASQSCPRPTSAAPQSIPSASRGTSSTNALGAQSRVPKSGRSTM